jgi:reactive intermediate/imine deaminase
MSVRDDREEFRVAGLSEPISHYTDAVRAGRLLFVSGCGPLDAEGSLVGGHDVLEQTRQVLANMQQALAAAGAGMSDVVKVTVYLTDIEDRQTVDIARREFFGATRPASTLFEVSRLALDGMKVEIECVAQLPGEDPA